MQLQDGGLYETKHGKRFRVTVDAGFFTCSSFNGFWYSDGEAAGKVTIAGKYRRPHLVREVDECRWIPASRETWLDYHVEHRSIKGKHRQIRVSREEACAIGKEGHEKAMLKTVAAPEVVTPAKSGEVRFQDGWGYTSGFNWKFIDEGGFLEITTTLGDVLKVRV